MKKKKFCLLFFSILSVTLLLAACSNGSMSNQDIRKTQAGDSGTTPTFFFHGWGSSVNAESHMVKAAKKAGVTKNVLTAIVDKNGNVKLVGHISKNAQNPIIKVGFLDNQDHNYRTDARFAYNAITAVQRKYLFTKMNLVGHSMGNMDIMFMLLYYGQHKHFPKLKRQVDIAGHFNGIRGMQSTAYSHNYESGKPYKMDDDYKKLLRLRRTYPKNASVMNIYGDLRNGTHSDEDVTIYSARTLKYLVSPRAGHYEEHMITGKNAQHSKLHENPQVDHLLIKFLWGK